MSATRPSLARLVGTSLFSPLLCTHAIPAPAFRKRGSYFWRSLPDSCSRGRRSTLESAPINITPRKKAPTWRWGPARPGVTSTLKQNGRSQEWSYASALTCSVSGIAWVRPDSDSRSVAQRTCWAHCRSCVRRNTWQRREQDVRRAAPKRRYSQMRRAQFDDFGVEQR